MNELAREDTDGKLPNSSIHENDSRFVDYYTSASATDQAFRRADSIMRTVQRVRLLAGVGVSDLKVADIGCNAGTQSHCWLVEGHAVSGLDISRELVNVARSRCKAFAERAEFLVGTATNLPWPSGSFDVCLLPELLEHVEDWETCLREAVRVTRSGGTIYVSTTNVLCPIQQEFNLPLYSWYPARLKRYFVYKATTSRPEIANYATCPAYHWFSPYFLKRFLVPLGLRVYDRFDLVDTQDKGRLARIAVDLARSIPPLRWIGHVLTPSTNIIAQKLH